MGIAESSQKWTPKRVLVTGGAGFIGSNLVEKLVADGYFVRVLDNFSTGKRENLDSVMDKIELIEGDITKTEDCARACEGMDVVSHQAAFGSVPKSMLYPELYSFNNLHGFVTLCNQARLAGIKRIVYASSSSVYGDSTDSPKRENHCGRPLSPYAASKQAKETFAQAFFNAYGMTMLGFRYFNVFGPKQNPDGPYAAVIPLFITKLLKKEKPFIYGDGAQARDFTFVSNVVQANLLGMTAVLNPGAYVLNIACGKSTSVNELLQKVSEKLNVPPEAIHKEERKGDIRNSLADISLARELIGYHAAVNIDEGLAITVQDYINRMGKC